MKAVRPLPVAGTEFVVYGEEQSEYEPLPALRTRDTVFTTWELSDEERAAIAAGADVHLTILVFGGPLQPVLLEVGPKPS